MIFKVFKKGTCGLRYVRGNTHRTSDGPDPRKPTLIGGDDQLTEAVIGALPFQNTFTSVCISFEQQVSDTQARDALRSMLEALLPGLQPGVHYIYAAFRHLEYPKVDAWLPTKKGTCRWKRVHDTSKPARTGVHVIIPNVELGSLRRLQPFFHRVDEKRMKLWQTAFNSSCGYRSPFDQHNRRALVSQTHQMPGQVREFKRQIQDELLAAVVAGTIRDRAEIEDWFRRIGATVSRRTRRSISITIPAHARPIRLTGQLFEEGGIDRYLAQRPPAARPNGCVDPAVAGELLKLIEARRRKNEQWLIRSPRGVAQDKAPELPDSVVHSAVHGDMRDLSGGERQPKSCTAHGNTKGGSEYSPGECPTSETAREIREAGDLARERPVEAVRNGSGRRNTVGLERQDNHRSEAPKGLTNAKENPDRSIDAARISPACTINGFRCATADDRAELAKSHARLSISVRQAEQSFARIAHGGADEPVGGGGQKLALTARILGRLRAAKFRRHESIVLRDLTSEHRPNRAEVDSANFEPRANTREGDRD